MRRLVVLIALQLCACSPALNTISDRVFPSRAAQFPVTASKGVSFVTDDGVELVADIYLPHGLLTAPTILVRIPFTNTLGNRIRSEVIARHWARRGYAVVIQGTRGRYKSGGEFYPLLFERADGIATLKWLAQQSWFDGRLAMWGGSSFGHTQWAIADQQDPGPSALSIQIASTNFRGMFYPGGAFSLESALQWAIRSSGSHDRDVDIADLKRGADHLPLIEADDIALFDTNFYNDWVSKRDDLSYWQQIDGTDRVQTLQCPALLIGGWYDPFLPTQIDDFIRVRTRNDPRISEKSRLIIGPWGHAQTLKLPGGVTEVPYRASSVTLSTSWFDTIFGLDVTPQPPVTIYIMGENRWREEREWPLARTRYTPFYLTSGGHANSVNGDGALHTEQASPAESDSFRYDPVNPVPTSGGAMLSERAGVALQNEVEMRDDVLVYSTPPLQEALEVTGPVRATLYVATDAISTDFTAKLVDVHPDGSAYNLSDGILRQRYVTSGTAKGRTATEIVIELWPTSNLFKVGHRIRLEISSSNFPRYDRNLNTGETPATATRSVIASQRIFHSSEYPSRIVLPIIPR